VEPGAIDGSNHGVLRLQHPPASARAPAVELWRCVGGTTHRAVAQVLTRSASSGLRRCRARVAPGRTTPVPQIVPARMYASLASDAHQVRERACARTTRSGDAHQGAPRDGVSRTVGSEGASYAYQLSGSGIRQAPPTARAPRREARSPASRADPISRVRLFHVEHSRAAPRPKALSSGYDI
jgi:hypothetical protein